MIKKTFAISRQISKAIKIMEDNDWKYPTRRIEDKMRKLGFKVCKSTGVAFIGERQVIKAHYPVSNKRPEKNKIAPTIKIKQIRNKYEERINWVIQEKVKILTDKEYSKNKKEITERFSSVIDNHHRNMGFYKNKIVLIDW
jgi:hypothetical protein